MEKKFISLIFIYFKSLYEDFVLFCCEVKSLKKIFDLDQVKSGKLILDAADFFSSLNIENFI